MLGNYKQGELAIAGKFTRLNGQIQASELRVVDETGAQLGVMSKRDALDLARERELDLVEVSPDAKPPVARIVDWGKYNYQRTKQQQKNKKAAKATELKQMRFGLKIGANDLNIKLRKVAGFLDDGHKVRLTIVYRGREQAHKELGFQMAGRINDLFGETIAVDQQPQLAGRQLGWVVHATGKGKTLDVIKSTKADKETEAKGEIIDA